MLGRILTVVFLAALIALSLIFQSTNPSQAGPVGLLAVFFLLYIIGVIAVAWTIHGVSQLVVVATKSVVVKKPLQVISLIHAYYFASVIAFAPVILLAMKSVTAIGIYEVLLVATFVVIGVFYIKKRVA